MLLFGFSTNLFEKWKSPSFRFRSLSSQPNVNIVRECFKSICNKIRDRNNLKSSVCTAEKRKRKIKLSGRWKGLLLFHSANQKYKLSVCLLNKFPSRLLIYFFFNFCINKNPLDGRYWIFIQLKKIYNSCSLFDPIHLKCTESPLSTDIEKVFALWKINKSLKLFFSQKNTVHPRAIFNNFQLKILISQSEQRLRAQIKNNKSFVESFEYFSILPKFTIVSK